MKSNAGVVCQERLAKKLTDKPCQTLYGLLTDSKSAPRLT
jgi:hypothetical protein